MYFKILTLVITVLFITGCVSPKTHYFNTTGTSMGPLINEGDLIECVESEHYNVGDIVVYNNTWVNDVKCHRIIYKEKGYYLMKGDNETMIDQGVQSFDDIICKVKT